jgi:hypothetical protein
MGKPNFATSKISSVLKRNGEPGEVKHLSTQRKRERSFIPLVAASEKGRAQTGAFNVSGLQGNNVGSILIL